MISIDNITSIVITLCNKEFNTNLTAPALVASTFVRTHMARHYDLIAYYATVCGHSIEQTSTALHKSQARTRAAYNHIYSTPKKHPQLHEKIQKAISNYQEAMFVCQGFFYLKNSN
jgi:hypothetical protein